MNEKVNSFAEYDKATRNTILAETYKSKAETYKSKAETYNSEAETYNSKLKSTIVS